MKILLIIALFECIACTNSSLSKSPDDSFINYSTSKQSITKNISAGEKILQIGKVMALQTKEILRGSCWDFINVAYNRAGFPQNKRATVFKGTKKNGPYAKASMIQPGDWLYYINHSYNDVPHSGIFVRWVDKKKKIASILSYGGESRNKPGRYRNYDISHVYNIIRPKE
ncbi:MAG: hypothetical protein KGV50_01690 [Gammaproteobacteria bacterium]|nr:hypothetical protein [Gammaproteobacteria bacterium]